MTSTTATRIVPEYDATTARVSPLRAAIIQTGAMFIDAYRELNHRKMFWIVLIISGVIVIGFAGVGINEKGITVFGWSLPLPFNTGIMSRADFYKMMFNTLGVSIWLAWVASILALISTAGLFPDMLTGGSIDLYLAKPISRLRLFLTKYTAALLFVTLQVGLFTLASFFVLGFRGGVWLWGLFLTVPIMVIFFSYLYSVCALLAILTRSTLAALLLTLLVWFGIYIIHTTEATLLFFKMRSQQEVAMYDRQISALEKKIAKLEATAATNPSTAPTVATTEESTGAKGESFVSKWARVIVQQREKMQGPQVTLANARLELAKVQKDRKEYSNPFVFWHNMAITLKTVLPKTTETIELLNRGLAKYADIHDTTKDSDEDPPPVAMDSRPHRFDDSPQEQELNRRAQREIINELHHRSIGWVIGTSLGFEAVMLALAAFIFVRRDF